MGFDIEQLYRQGAGGYIDFVAGLDEDAWTMPVPCCPEWTVHDVTAHVAGLADDVLAGRVEGAGTDPWTAEQVVRGHDRTVPELLDGWRQRMDEVAGIFKAFDDPRPVLDVHTHEHDVRQALGRPGARSSEIVKIGADLVLQPLQEHHELRLELDDGRVIGSERHGAAVTLRHVTPFEVFRSRLGRRSVAQVAAYDWLGDPAGVIGDWFVFGPASNEIDER